MGLPHNYLERALHQGTFPRHTGRGTRHAELFQSVSASLCSYFLILPSYYFSAQSKEKCLRHCSNGSGLHYVWEIPPENKGRKISRRCAAGKVRMQTGLGWQVCRALIRPAPRD